LVQRPATAGRHARRQIAVWGRAPRSATWGGTATPNGRVVSAGVAATSIETIPERETDSTARRATERATDGDVTHAPWAPRLHGRDEGPFPRRLTEHPPSRTFAEFSSAPSQSDFVERDHLRPRAPSMPESGSLSAGNWVTSNAAIGSTR